MEKVKLRYFQLVTLFISVVQRAQFIWFYWSVIARFIIFILVHCPKYCTHKVELHFSRSINFYLINDEVECVKHLHPTSANQLRTSIRLKYTKIILNVQVNGDLFCVVRISKYGLNTTLDDRSNYLQTLSFSLLLQYYYYYYYCY